MNGLLTKRHQLEALQIAADKYPKLGIGASYMSLLKYEKLGVVLPPSHQILVNDKEWRFYTQDEIEENVKRVIAFKQQKVAVIK